MNGRTMLLSHQNRALRSLSLMLLWIACRAFAQFNAATVTGVVQDSSRAGITNAKLKLINTQTGTENDSNTDQEGGFLLPGVIPGTYTLQIERDGFATTQVNGISLNAGATKNLLIRMKIGAVTETVNVDASGLTLNRTNATVSTVVDRKLIVSASIFDIYEGQGIQNYTIKQGGTKYHGSFSSGMNRLG